MSPDIKKVEALMLAEPPKNISELRSFLCMINFSSSFIENYSAKTCKLRELLKNDTKCHWIIDHQTALELLRNSLLEKSILSYFDVPADTKVICDASPFGLGTILVQTQRTGEDKII